MGFTPPRKTYLLDFEGTELDGLEVKARSASLGVMLELGAMVDGFEGVPDQDAVARMPQEQQLSMVKGSMDKLRGIIDMYAQVLVSWNYEVDGQPVPADRDGMLTLDPPQLMMIVKAWQQAVAAAPAPLSQPSSGGMPSAALSLPMESLSESLAS